MSPQKLIKQEARLAAIEFMLAYLLKQTYAVQKASPEVIASSKASIIAALRSNGVPGLDPALSDHLMAELEDAVQQILDKETGITVAGS